MTATQATHLFLIRSARHNDKRFEQQRQAIRATGAQFDDRSQEWFLHVHLTPPPVETINEMLTLATDHGATIRLVPLGDE